jgi:hypothetical protein
MKPYHYRQAPSGCKGNKGATWTYIHEEKFPDEDKNLKIKN